MVRPVNSSHGLLKKLHSLSGPDIQMRTGAASAVIRKRSSLSRSSVSVVARSSINAAKNNSGTDRTIRNIWIPSALCSADPAENGPCPRAVLQMAAKVMIEIAVVAPNEPNRNAAHRSNGTGRKSKAESAPDPTLYKTMKVIESKPRKTTLASRKYQGCLFRSHANPIVAHVTIVGATVSAAKTFEVNRIRKSSQYPPWPHSFHLTNAASKNDDKKGPINATVRQKIPTLRTLLKRTCPPMRYRASPAAISASQQLLMNQQRTIVRGT